MDYLIIGDPHGKLSMLNDFQSGLRQLVELVRHYRPARTVVMGDLFDTFAVLRSEILNAWNDFVNDVHQQTELVLIVGNHDYAGPSGGAHALKIFAGKAKVIDSPTKLGDEYFFPFVRDNARFEEWCKEVPAGAVLFCHQSFNGAQFENGFYDPHGADTAAVAHLRQVISGHVHKRQQVANVTYVGTPWQLSFADAGEQKGVVFGMRSSEGLGMSDVQPLEMPQFHVIERPTVAELLTAVEGLEAIPVPRGLDSYRLVAEGTPQEVEAFWQDPRVTALKSWARRVDNSLKVVRSESVLAKVQGETLQDKVSSFIAIREWKVSKDILARKAGELLLR